MKSPSWDHETPSAAKPQPKTQRDSSEGGEAQENTEYKTLVVERLSEKVEISWSREREILQSTDTIGGTWSGVAGATSPYLIDPAGEQRFFRIKAE